MYLQTELPIRAICLLLILLTLTSIAQAASINIIQLTNRQAVEVIPVIEPMLGPGDAISGQGFKIFLRSSPETLAEVKEMIAALDAPGKTLQISVFQGSSQTLKQQGLSANIQIADGNVSGSISGANSQQSRQSNPVHRVRVSEGREAYIETGQQIPFFSGGLNSRNLLTGFYVLPRIHGHNVTLEVSPFKNALSSSNGNSIDTQSANTTITGRIGQWLLIGDFSEQSSHTQNGIVSQNSSESSRDESIWIRAELIR